MMKLTAVLVVACAFALSAGPAATQGKGMVFAIQEAGTAYYTIGSGVAIHQLDVPAVLADLLRMTPPFAACGLQVHVKRAYGRRQPSRGDSRLTWKQASNNPGWRE